MTDGPLDLEKFFSLIREFVKCDEVRAVVYPGWETTFEVYRDEDCDWTPILTGVTTRSEKNAIEYLSEITDNN